LGKVIKAPQVYSDERGQVTTDYQDYLEKEWVKTLREKYPVVLNEEVWAKIKK
jgi:peptidyl-prolyl cis-trans isomerase SurA